MRGVTSISITLLIIASSMAGCIEALEEVTEVLGCTDEGADNFDADATSGLEELCLYLENEVRFIAAMTDAMAADPSSYLLDPTSGVSGCNTACRWMGSMQSLACLSQWNFCRLSWWT